MVLLEAGPVVSILIAPHVCAERDGGAIRLEDCTYLRVTTRSGRLSACHYPRVEILHDPGIQHWLASPDGFDSVLPMPSRVPYAIIELSELTSRAVENALHEGDNAAAFMMIRVRFAALPGFFSSRPGKLSAPGDYAAGRDAIAGRYRLIE